MIRLEGNKSELYQWDSNMRIILINVPAGTEVHYSNANYNMDENCITVVSYSENGRVYADIPNKILQTSGVVLVYLYVRDGDKAWTEFKTEILVLPRKKPANYVYTETETKTFEGLEKRIENLESTQDPDAIKNAVKDYIEQNPVEVSVQSVNGQTGKVELNAEDVGAIAETELHTAINTALAQAKASGEFDGADGEPGPQGPKGETGPVGPAGADGQPGRDGTDGAPGRDGVDGQPGKDGKDGITPTIGDNGNWFLGATDTGKPSRGATGDTGPQGPAGKDGAGMDITGATVGQIAKISAVDENGKPTAWEPVDMAIGRNAELPLIYDFTTSEEARWIDTGGTAFSCAQEFILELTAVATETNTSDNVGCASIYTASTSIGNPWTNNFMSGIDGMLPKQYSRYFVAHGRKGSGGGWLVDFTIRTIVNGSKVQVHRTFGISGVWAETITGIIIGDASAQIGTRVLGAGTRLRIFGV